MLVEHIQFQTQKRQMYWTDTFSTSSLICWTLYIKTIRHYPEEPILGTLAISNLTVSSPESGVLLFYGQELLELWHFFLSTGPASWLLLLNSWPSCKIDILSTESSREGNDRRHLDNPGITRIGGLPVTSNVTGYWVQDFSILLPWSVNYSTVP